VLVLYRARFPRTKVCGGFVSAEGVSVLERLGLADALERAGAAPIDRYRLTVPTGPALEGALPDLPGIRRRALGVSRAMRKSSSSLMEARATSSDWSQRS
jgi:hypothetical protein